MQKLAAARFVLANREPPAKTPPQTARPRGTTRYARTTKPSGGSVYRYESESAQEFHQPRGTPSQDAPASARCQAVRTQTTARTEQKRRPQLHGRVQTIRRTKLGQGIRTNTPR